MNDPTFYKYPPLVLGSDTSEDAAASMEHLTSTIRGRVYARIRQHGATCDEIEQELGLTHQTASARVNELRNRGFIEDSKARRKTRSGRNAVVYIACMAPMLEGREP